MVIGFNIRMDQLLGRILLISKINILFIWLVIPFLKRFIMNQISVIVLLVLNNIDRIIDLANKRNYFISIRCTSLV